MTVFRNSSRPRAGRSRWTKCVASGIVTISEPGALTRCARSRSRSSARDQKSRSPAMTSVRHLKESGVPDLFAGGDVEGIGEGAGRRAERRRRACRRRRVARQRLADVGRRDLGIAPRRLVGDGNTAVPVAQERRSVIQPIGAERALREPALPRRILEIGSGADRRGDWSPPPYIVLWSTSAATLAG